MPKRSRGGASGPAAVAGAAGRGGSRGSRIHRGLVGDRALIGTPYLADPALRAEYDREIAPRTRVALTKILRQLFPAGTGRAAGTRRPRRVLDLGAGTGAATAAVAAHFGGEVDLVALDRLAGLPGVKVADVTDVGAVAKAGAPFDLVVAAHLLNELYVGLPAERRGPALALLVRRWCEELLDDGGTLVLLEPALRETSRALLAVRDRLLADGLHVVAPCFFTGPCPALVRDRDWCHDSATDDDMTDGDGGDAGRRVDFSYLVVRPTGEAVTDPSLFRVVSDPLVEKGRLRIFGCGADGRQALIRLDRHATPANADMDGIERGDVAIVRRTAFARDGLRIGPDTTVTRR